MAHRLNPVLHPVAIAALRPTQLTVGLREVERKRAEWRTRPAHERGEYLGRHMIPAVLGPGEVYWLVDHHHLARALHEEGEEQVLVTVLARLHHLPKKRFMAFMDAHNWLHPYDEAGKRREWKALPRHVSGLVDDPYRSLAGALRMAGGYAKSPAPYSEFLWADFLRDRIKPKLLDEHFERALARALELARSHAAHHLPGWAGPETGPG
ncbi:MAG: chromosome partitioning protein ParB [Proteobacteria bacterium]|nr:chromosome partitioning protein ParB [Pseudomonadota bacterium]